MDDKTEYRGWTIHIAQDEEPFNPRDGETLGRMICKTRYHDLGDGCLDTVEEILETISGKGVISLPIYLYDHSGIGISTDNSQYPFNCPWDSGQVGYIYVTQIDCLNYMSIKSMTKTAKKKALEILRKEVETYNAYISGDVLCMYIRNEHGDNVYSCGNYFDYRIEDVISEGKCIIDNMIKMQ